MTSQPSDRPMRDPRTARRMDLALRVRDQLRSAIVAGDIAAGMMPTEAELMVTFSASRQVIRDALDLLRDEGHVIRKQGSGTMAASEKFVHDFTHLHTSPKPGLMHRIISIERETAMPRVAAKLGLEPNAECAVVRYATFYEGTPSSFYISYLRPSLLPILAPARVGVADWFALYERAGIEIGVTDFTVEATIADENVAAILEVAPGVPLMLLERLLRDVDGVPLEFGFSRIRADRFAIRTQVARRRPRPVGDGA